MQRKLLHILEQSAIVGIDSALRFASEEISKQAMDKIEFKISEIFTAFDNQLRAKYGLSELEEKGEK